MNLPYNALVLIREYARPLTRPDWRNLNRIPLYKLYKEIMHKKNTNWNYGKIFQLFIINIQRGFAWSELDIYSKLYGIKICSEITGIEYKVLEKILKLK
jgi:hypothetical protein